MFNWLGLNAVNPWLLLGTLGVASPIIIHLLSKRRFKVVDWAAMNFLLDADRRNRRRIRLEHLLLLLLRCLAILLLALLVSRPYRQATGLAAALAPSIDMERIVLLDDSPSTRQQVGSETVFQRAKQALAGFVRTAADERSGDTMTLLLTSEPTTPMLAGAYLSKERDAILQQIDRLEPSDTSARLGRALIALERELEEQESSGAGNLNRTIYVVTDLRQRDWGGVVGDQSKDAIVAVLERLGEKSQGVVVIDVGEAQPENLSVESVVSVERTLVAGVRNRFEVVVRNHGTTEARNVKVTFTADEAPPQFGYIDAIPAGGVGSAPFRFTFIEPGSTHIRAEIEPDALPTDNARDFVARVRDGVRVLVVDGDPSSERNRSESYYLARAVAPRQGELSGNSVSVVTESQFASASLDRYQVIVLCNVYQVPGEQQQALRHWVEAGGGLVFYLGDQIDDDLYNRELGEEGAGLLPARLLGVAGDDTERTWVTPTNLAANHPLVSVFEGVNNPFIKRVKVFQWWRVEPFEGDADTTVVAMLTDEQASPMIVERNLGDGRVVLVAISADGDWTTWPVDESYGITALEMVRHLARQTADEGNVPVGVPLLHPLEVSRFKVEAQMIAPGASDPATLQAGAEPIGGPDPSAAGDAAAPDDGAAERAVRMVFRYPRTAKAGVYRLELERFDGSTEPVLFAVNSDPREGDLAAMDRGVVAKALEGAKVQLVQAADVLDTGGEGGRAELWRGVLIAVLVVLGLEQTLAWSFGRRR